MMGRIKADNQLSCPPPAPPNSECDDSEMDSEVRDPHVNQRGRFWKLTVGTTVIPNHPLWSMRPMLNQWGGVIAKGKWPIYDGHTPTTNPSPKLFLLHSHQGASSEGRFSPCLHTNADSSPLQDIAVLLNRVDLVTSLIKNRARVDDGDSEKATPFHFLAATHKDLQMALLLLKHGARVNSIESYFGETPLTLATRKANFRFLRFLLDKGAEICWFNALQQIGRICWVIFHFLFIHFFIPLFYFMDCLLNIQLRISCCYLNSFQCNNNIMSAQFTVLAQQNQHI